ncbi:MAG TPA: SHOCT domain-containing protein [Arenibaculum sp.]|nr:SHOCT domain-containing protein [Arenibaculum sp.]
MRLAMRSAAIAIIPALAAPGFAWGQGGPGTRSGMGMMGGMSDGWAWWMPLQGLLFMGTFFAFIVGAILLLRYFWHLGDRPQGQAHSSHHARGSSALDLLDTRYARGEIDREDYLQRRRDVLGHGG